MKTPALVLAFGLIVFAGCGKKEETPAKATNSTVGNPITAPVDYLGAIGQAKKHSEATIDTVSIDRAIQMFSSEEGRLPKNLNELITEKYLPRLPTPPYGMTYAYNPQTGQVKVVPKPAPAAPPTPGR